MTAAAGIALAASGAALVAGVLWRRRHERRLQARPAGELIDFEMWRQLQRRKSGSRR